MKRDESPASHFSSLYLRSMRIAFDAKRIFHNTSGLGNYGRNLINSLEQYYPDNDYLLFTPRNGRVPFKPASSRILYPDTNTPALWRSFSIIRQIAREQPDIYHGLSNELPFYHAFSKMSFCGECTRCYFSPVS